MKVKELIRTLQSFNDPEAPVVLCDLEDDGETGTYNLDEKSIAYVQGQDEDDNSKMGVLICFKYCNHQELEEFRENDPNY